MKNLFKNKFMIVLIVISILLVGTTSFISALGYTSYVRNAIGIVLTPVQKGIDYVFDSVKYFFSSKEDFSKLKEENENLKEKISEQEKLLAEAELALEENEKLKDFLSLKEEHTDLVLCDASVTGRQSGDHSSLITLDKGSFHGVEPGMPVVDKYGVVGCVSEVGLTFCKALTVTDPGVSVGVVVERTGEAGVSSGTFSSFSDGVCEISFLPQDADVRVGDRIVTSENGSIYPAGLLVGTVESVRSDPVSREIIAIVRPAANIDGADSVMIITSFEKAYE